MWMLWEPHKIKENEQVSYRLNQRQNNKEEEEEVKPTNETRGRWGDDQRHDNKDRWSGGGNNSMGHSPVTFVLHFFSIHFKGFFFTDRFLFSSQNGRHSPVRLVYSGIDWYFERYDLKVFLYCFTHWNKKYWPYRPVQYSINSLVYKTYRILV